MGRATPGRASASGESPSSRSPPSRISPPSAGVRPLITLKSVVLPAPFGPMRPVIEPSRTESVHPASASTPPKRLVIPVTEGSGIVEDLPWLRIIRQTRRERQCEPVVGFHGTVVPFALHSGKKEQAMTDRPEVVMAVDGRVTEGDATYERIDPEYRERRPRYTQASRGYIVRLVDGKVWGPDTDIGFVGVNGNLGPPKGKAIHYRRMGTYNPWARLSDMDKDQIDTAVIYPTDELPLTVTLDGGFAAARARAYNDWLHDYCEVCPQRLKGVGLVALQDVRGAIGEIHRAMRRLNMVAITSVCTVREDTLLSDARLTPFWAEAERLNVAVAVHGPALPSLFRSYFDINRPDHMLEASHMAHTFAQMLACSYIITSGILERF